MLLQLLSACILRCTGTEGAPAQAPAPHATPAGAAAGGWQQEQEVDAAKPTTTLQIRLADGTRLTGQTPSSSALISL